MNLLSLHKQMNIGLDEPESACYDENILWKWPCLAKWLSNWLTWSFKGSLDTVKRKIRTLIPCETQDIAFLADIMALLDLFWYWKLLLIILRSSRFPYCFQPHKHNWYSVPQKGHFMMVKKYYTLRERGPSEPMDSVISLKHIWYKAKISISFPWLILHIFCTCYVFFSFLFFFFWHSWYLDYPIITFGWDSIWLQWIPSRMSIWSIGQWGLLPNLKMTMTPSFREINGRNQRLRLNTGMSWINKNTWLSWLTRLSLWSNSTLGLLVHTFRSKDFVSLIPFPCKLYGLIQVPRGFED